MAGQGGAAFGAGDQPFGDGALCRVQPFQENAGLCAHRVADDLFAALEFFCDGGLDQRSLDLQKLLRQRDKHRHRQGTVTLVRRRLESEGHACPEPLGSGLFHAELGCNRIRRAKADPSHVTGEPIRVLGHDFDRLVTVGLEDANRASGAHPVSVQEDHDLADRLLLGPARHDLRGPPGADARNLRQSIRTGLNDLEGRLAKCGDDTLSHRGPDAAHLP